MSILRSALAIAAKDLRIERRTRTALLSSAVFTALVLLIFVFAREEGSVSSQALAPSVLWITLALTLTITLNRAFVLERQNAAFDALVLAPVPRVAIFWGKWLANLAFVLTVMAIAFPLWMLFLQVRPTPVLLATVGIAVLAAIGETAVGTMFSAIAVRTRYAELLLPVLLLPFLITPLFAAAQSSMRLLAGRPLAEVQNYLTILVLYDVAFLALATLLFPRMMDE